MNSIDQVEEFHRVFKQPVLDRPDLNNKSVCLMRLHLLQEELGELSLALCHGDIVSAFDALTDLQYVLDGTYLALGFKAAKEAGMAAVHASNMTKLDSQGKPVLSAGGRVIKSELYKPVDLRAVLLQVYGEGA